MESLWLKGADLFFLFFHTGFTLFNLFGWIFTTTRKIHLVTMGLTAFSWFFLGIWYGFGFCLCTEWHWKIRLKLGTPVKSRSYIHFLIKEITGINFDPHMIDRIVIILFLFSATASVYINLWDYLKKRHR